MNRKTIALVALSASLGLAGCAAGSKILGDLGAPPIVAQIGADLVTVECTSASSLSVAAQDANASARIQALLASNSKLAADLCPIVGGTPATQITATINAPAPVATTTPAIVIPAAPAS